MPSSSDQRKSERVVRDLYKDAYKGKGRAAKRALALKLLESGQQTVNDLTAKYVLLREAREAAIEALDLHTAFAAIDIMAGVYEIQAGKMKTDALRAALKYMSTKEDAVTVADFYLELARGFISQERFADALSAARSSERYAKKGGENTLEKAAEVLTKEIPDLKREHQTAQSFDFQASIDLGARTDNLTAGHYLCFVKGDWEKGPEYLVWGSNPALKKAGEGELTKPEDSEARVALADIWWSLSQKERSPLYQRRYQERARLWYDLALPEARGLLQARIKKQLSEIRAKGIKPNGVNLLRLIIPKAHAVQGEWGFDERTLVCSKMVSGSRIRIPFRPPEEYDLEITGQRVEGSGSLLLGIAGAHGEFALELDQAQKSGIQVIDGKHFFSGAGNETTVSGNVFPRRKNVTLVCSVRVSSVSVRVAGKDLLSWNGDLKRLSMGNLARIPNHRGLFLGCFGSRFNISRILLSPLSGKGQKLR